MSEAIKPLDEDLEKINIFDPELMACPHAFFKKLLSILSVPQIIPSNLWIIFNNWFLENFLFLGLK